jgi:hypothetical protein
MAEASGARSFDVDGRRVAAHAVAYGELRPGDLIHDHRATWRTTDVKHYRDWIYVEADLIEAIDAGHVGREQAFEIHSDDEVEFWRLDGQN